MNTRTRPDIDSLALTGQQRARAREFGQPRHEFRRMAGEAFGTFLLVLAAAGAPVADALTAGGVGRVAEVTAPGLTVLVVILAFGANSGAHLNPVVSLAFAMRGDFPWRRLVGYIVAQTTGAVLASLAVLLLVGRHGSDGVTAPAAGLNDVQALSIEAVLTLGLVSVVLGAASGAQNIGALSAFAAGGYVILAGLWASPLTGASMNPARSLGPAIVAGSFDHLWVYIAGPVAGAVAAVGLAIAFRGRAGDPTAAKAATGGE